MASIRDSIESVRYVVPTTSDSLPVSYLDGVEEEGFTLEELTDDAYELEKKKLDETVIKNWARDRIAELVSLGYGATDIRDILNADLVSKKYKPLKMSQIKSGIEETKLRWRAKLSQGGEDIVSLIFERFEREYRKAVELGDTKGAVRVLEAECKLLGLNAPKRIEARSEMTIAEISDERRKLARDYFDGKAELLE